MSAVSGSPTQVKTSVTTAADLAGTPDDAFKEGDLACVTALWPNSTFRLRRVALGSTPDNVATIATFSGNGYWEVFGVGGGGMLVFETIGDLAAYDDSALTDGLVVYVQSVRSYFSRLVQDDPLTADGITNVENPTNTATWYRSSEASPSWLNQLDWYIDGATGDDEGSGALAEPLLTHDEFMRRLGQNKLTRSLTVNFVTDAVAGFNFAHSTLPGQHNGFSVLYKGPDLSALTPVYTEEFSGYSAISRVLPGQRANFLSALALGTWQTYVGKTLLITAATDPAIVGAYAIVCEVAPGGDTDTSVFTTPFIMATPDNLDPAPVDPVDGDTYVVVDPLSLTFNAFLASFDEAVLSNEPSRVQFQFLGLDLPKDNAFSRGTTAVFAGWIFGAAVTGGSLEAWGCQMLGSTSVQSNFTAYACFIDGTTDSSNVFALGPASHVTLAADCVAQGSTTVSASKGQLSLSDFGAFGVDGDAVTLDFGAQAVVGGYLYGEDTTGSFFTLGAGTRVVNDGATLLATTDGFNVSFGGVVTQNWGGVPFVANAAATDSQAAWLDA